MSLKYKTQLLGAAGSEVDLASAAMVKCPPMKEGQGV